MANDNFKHRTISIEVETVSLSVVYPDGSVVQLSMPRPAELAEPSGPKAEAIVTRLARRLLVVAAEDLA